MDSGLGMYNDHVLGTQAIFMALAPRHMKDLANSIEELWLPRIALHRLGKFDFTTVLSLGAVVTTMCIVVSAYIIPQGQDLQHASDVLCAGSLDFVFSVDKAGLAYWATTTPASEPPDYRKWDTDLHNADIGIPGKIPAASKIIGSLLQIPDSDYSKCDCPRNNLDSVQGSCRQICLNLRYRMPAVEAGGRSVVRQHQLTSDEWSVQYVRTHLLCARCASVYNVCVCMQVCPPARLPARQTDRPTGRPAGQPTDRHADQPTNRPTICLSVRVRAHHAYMPRLIDVHAIQWIGCLPMFLFVHVSVFWQMRGTARVCVPCVPTSAEFLVHVCLQNAGCTNLDTVPNQIISIKDYVDGDTSCEGGCRDPLRPVCRSGVCASINCSLDVLQHCSKEFTAGVRARMLCPGTCAQQDRKTHIPSCGPFVVL